MGTSPQSGGWLASAWGYITDFTWNATRGTLSPRQVAAQAGAEASDIVRAGGNVPQAIAQASADQQALQRLGVAQLPNNVGAYVSSFLPEPASWSPSGILVTALGIVAVYLMVRAFTR